MALFIPNALLLTLILVCETHAYSKYEMAKEIRSLHAHAHHDAHHRFAPLSHTHDGSPQEIPKNVPPPSQPDKASCGPQLPGINEITKVSFL